MARRLVTRSWARFWAAIGESGNDAVDDGRGSTGRAIPEVYPAASRMTRRAALASSGSFVRRMGGRARTTSQR